MPDLLLKGHDDVAQFALAASSCSPHVASGGRDKKVSGRQVGTRGGEGGGQEVRDQGAGVEGVQACVCVTSAHTPSAE